MDYNLFTKTRYWEKTHAQIDLKSCNDLNTQSHCGDLNNRNMF